MLRILGQLVIVGALAVGGCASAPKSASARSELEMDAARAKQAMLTKDPALHSLLDQAAGYIVFPEVKQGGFVVGAANGKGVVYEKGRFVGYANLTEASVGAQVGGQKFAEMVIVRDRFTLDKIKSGSLDVGAQASAVIIRQGVAAATQFGNNGVAVVIDPLGGAMVNASVSGQRIKTTM
jgi:lipid-binding SYLF domain-containing protein